MKNSRSRIETLFDLVAETVYFLEEKCEKMFCEDFHQKESRNLIKTNVHFLQNKKDEHIHFPDYMTLQEIK